MTLSRGFITIVTSFGCVIHIKRPVFFTYPNFLKFFSNNLRTSLKEFKLSPSKTIGKNYLPLIKKIARKKKNSHKGKIRETFLKITKHFKKKNILFSLQSIHFSGLHLPSPSQFATSGCVSPPPH